MAKVTFPDFIFARRDGDTVRLALCEPHEPERVDALPKAMGLAAYARDDGGPFERIEICAKINPGGPMLRLDLLRLDVREEVLRASSSSRLVEIYGALGKSAST